MNDYNAFTQSAVSRRASPGCCTSTRRWRIATETLAEVDRAIDTLGLKGLYYSHDFSRHGYARNLDHDAFRPFWDKIARATAAGLRGALLDAELRPRELCRQPARARPR